MMEQRGMGKVKTADSKINRSTPLFEPVRKLLAEMPDNDVRIFAEKWKESEA